MLRYSTILLGLLLFASAAPADAQDYLFSVPTMRMLVTVAPDASVQIAYEIAFQNTPGRHPIDIVDIGLPHAGCDLSKVRAWIDGQPVTDIRVSEYVNPGFEVHLGSATIAPGGSGTLRVEFPVPRMVYQDTTRADYASLQITPTWFGDKYVRGTTDLQIAVQLPKGVQPDQAVYQNEPFTQKAATPDGAMVGWVFKDTRLTGPHKVGVSFPKGELPAVRVTAIDLLLKWFRESPHARINLGIAFLVLFGFLFFRFSAGTGFSAYVVLSAGACALFFYSPGAHLLSIPIVIGLIGLNEWFLDRRKLQYMPPIAQVEGGGIKRGLTAPEAAVLLELPVAKALSLVVFGLLKKGLARQTQADPLAVEAALPSPASGRGAGGEGSHDESQSALTLTLSRSRERGPDEKIASSPDASDHAALWREAAVKKGVVVHDYELPFLFLLQNNPGKPLREIDFGIPMRKLIQDTAARMKGFDLSDTKDYYRAIVSQAMQQAAAIGDIQQQEKTIDRNFEWILMDDAYPTVFGNRPYRPIWTRGSVFPASGGGTSASPSIPGTTSFGDVASSFAGWAENTMGSLASSISPGSLNLPHPSGGFLDLSGVDHVTGEFFKALAEASTSGGGGGGGGCACAGCACACACAGGGR